MSSRSNGGGVYFMTKLPVRFLRSSPFIMTQTISGTKNAEWIILIRAALVISNSDASSAIDLTLPLVSSASKSYPLRIVWIRLEFFFDSFFDCQQVISSLCHIVQYLPVLKLLSLQYGRGGRIRRVTILCRHIMRNIAFYRVGWKGKKIVPCGNFTIRWITSGYGPLPKKSSLIWRSKGIKRP